MEIVLEFNTYKIFFENEILTHTQKKCVCGWIFFNYKKSSYLFTHIYLLRYKGIQLP